MPHKKLISLTSLILLSIFAFSCSNAASDSNLAASVPEVKLTAVERDIKAMKTAEFEFIFVFRRKDGGVFDRDDSIYLKANSPAETNRFALTDGDKVVVAGSSFKFEPEQIDNLRERFDVEDHSVVQESDPNTNVNANVISPANKK